MTTVVGMRVLDDRGEDLLLRVATRLRVSVGHDQLFTELVFDQGDHLARQDEVTDALES